MQKLKTLFESPLGQRLLYEAKSFAITFLGVYIALNGITEATTIQYLADNKEVLLSSLGVALTRSLVIYILKLVGLDYRDQTAKYR